MDPQEALQRQKRSLESAEFERKLFEQQAADLEDAIEARREEMKRAGDQAQAELQREKVLEDDYIEEDNLQIQENQIEQQQIAQIEQSQEEAQIKSDQNQTLLERARGFLKEEGHEVDDEDLKKLTKEKPERPGFPTGMLTLAVFKDILDLVLTLTIVGIVLVFLYSVLYFIISFVWTMSRVSRVSFAGKFAIKKIRNMAVRKWLTRNGLEMVPVVQVLPLATFFVILNHYSDTKLVKTFVKAAEMLEGGDFDND